MFLRCSYVVLTLFLRCSYVVLTLFLRCSYVVLNFKRFEPQCCYKLCSCKKRVYMFVMSLSVVFFPKK